MWNAKNGKAESMDEIETPPVNIRDAIRGEDANPGSSQFVEFTSQDLEASVTARFERIAAIFPSAIAVKSQGKELTYAELNRAANRLAHAMVERCGRASEPVALLSDRDNSFFIALVAALKANKFYFALDPNFPAARLNEILDDSGARLILTTESQLALASRLRTPARDVLNLDQSSSYPDTNLGLEISPDDLVCIYYTSGSTGAPKGVADSHRRLLRSVSYQISNYRTGIGDRFALLGSTGFATTRWQIFTAFLSGAGLYQFDIQTEGLSNLAEWLSREEITIYTSTPTLFRHLAMTLEDHPEIQFPKMRFVGLGGEPALKRDFESYQKYFPDHAQFRISYASTEGGSIASLILNKQSQVTGNILPVGYIAKGKQVLIVDEQDRVLGFDQVGEIVVKSSYLPRGFWQQGQLTQEAYRSDEGDGGLRTFRTGDLGRMRADGLLEFIGRKDEQVKIRGFRIELAEIEMALLDIPGIKDACVVARDEREDEKQLVAYVIADPKSTPTISEIRAALAKKLPDYMIPSAIEYLDAFPLLPNGKIDRRALPAPERGARKTTDAYRAPRDRYELEMVRLWEELLGIEPVGTQDNFFDLGGHSLLAARLLVEIEKRYGQKFPPRILLQASTVEQLAQLLYDEGWQPAWPPAVPIHAEGTRPPLFYIPPFNAVFGFYQLDALIERDQPVYGLLASPGGDEFPFTRVEDEAAYYLSQIKTIQPQGPYYLAGWSSGGLVALETAQRLVRAGQTVAFLGLFDTVIRSRDLRSQAEYSSCRLKYFWRLGPRQLLVRAIARVRRYASGHFDPVREEHRAEFLGEFRQRPDYAAIADRVGYRGYVPQNYPGRVNLFLTTTPRLNPCVDPVKHWSRLAAGVQVHAIPGVHNAIFEEPHARPVIEKLQAALRQAQTAPRDELPIEKSS